MAKSEKIKWQPTTKSLSELIPYEHNPRRITEKGMKDLKKSLDKFGLADPIVINKDGTIIGGHARYFALKETNGKEKINVIIPDRQLTEKEIKELNVRLNKNIAGEFDFDILANEFNLDDLLDWGFNERELGGLSIEQINELDEWNKNNIDEFQIADQLPKLVISFKTLKKREKFVDENELIITHKQAGTWSVTI